MSDAKVRPYTGEKSYIFISYSHKDMEQVLPILRHMEKKGYRIWYDEGIDPGTEWDEIIAAHIDACGYFIALISQNYLDSSNCKDELHYARDTEKKRLLVYLENIELPSGMRMRLSRLQNIHKYAYSKDEDFYDKLFTAEDINECKEQAAPETVSGEEPVVVVPEEPVITEAAELEIAVAEVVEEEETEKNSEHEEPGVNWAEILKYKVSRGKVTITGLKDWKKTELIIPEMIEGNPVTKIAEGAFNELHWDVDIERVELPDSIIAIGDEAFKDCKRLKSITISKGVKKLPYAVFSGCTELAEVKILGKLSKIEKDAFEDCISLKEIEFPKGVTTIENCAFSGCGIWDDKDLKGIDNLYYSENGRTATIEGIKKKNIVELIIPDYADWRKVTEICCGAFSGCANIEKVILPDSLKCIRSYAFSRCSALTDINLPDGLEEIGAEAFEGCDNLSVLELPSSVVRVGKDIHKNVVRKEAVVEKSTAIGSVANECAGKCSGFRPTGPANKIIDKTDGVDWDKIFGYTIENNEITITRLRDRTLIHVTVPSSINGYPVKCVGDLGESYVLESIKFSEGITTITGSFYRFWNLKYIEFPDSLVNIRRGTFNGTPWLKEQQKISPLVVVNGTLI